MAHDERLTRSGKPFSSFSIAEFFRANPTTQLPAAATEFGQKKRGVCIDDGIMTHNPAQQLVPLSGVGVGEDPRKIAEILEDVDKIKPHIKCGKAALELRRQFEKLGKTSLPTAEQVDVFAERAAWYLAELLGIERGRILDFHDGRGTELDRPEDHHPADGAVIGLSGRFLHNLVPDESELPPQFRLAGHYFEKPHLEDIATSEALLALTIASGEHGVGITEHGFRYTALVDQDDPLAEQKLQGLHRVWDRLQGSIEDQRAQGIRFNDTRLDIVSCRVRPRTDHCEVTFGVE